MIPSFLWFQLSQRDTGFLTRRVSKPSPNLPHSDFKTSRYRLLEINPYSDDSSDPCQRTDPSERGNPLDSNGQQQLRC
ncbi:hypothetical protein L873DRAFT_1387946 [Choiromyces venosus 120613-1]|uniref:Uncharacterized protein n=1 Tax=Choiromyces venosus 120613-1 TaxID=1336337 RepID=A0A3N4J9J9_9PEZI|nr:hypothetical protein L873DRAFT_1387946 [Choiromyces venosus 120613-1]